MLRMRMLPPRKRPADKTRHSDHQPNAIAQIAGIQRWVALRFSFAPRGDRFEFHAALFARFLPAVPVASVRLRSGHGISRQANAASRRVFRRKKIRHRLVFVESQIFCVSADKAFVEDAAWEFVEIFGLERLKVALADGGFGDLLQRHAAQLALALDPFTERCHGFLVPEVS